MKCFVGKTEIQYVKCMFNMYTRFTENVIYRNTRQMENYKQSKTMGGDRNKDRLCRFMSRSILRCAARAWTCAEGASARAQLNLVRGKLRSDNFCSIETLVMMSLQTYKCDDFGKWRQLDVSIHCESERSVGVTSYANVNDQLNVQGRLIFGFHARLASH